MGLFSKAHAAWLLRHEDKTQIRADYADQQRRLEAGEKLRDGERRIDGKRCQTKRKFASVAPVVHKEDFLQRTTGLFAASAIPSCKRPSRRGPLPPVVAMDPGHCNVWAASVSTDGGTWKGVTQLSSGQYRTGIGLRAFQQWSQRSLRRPHLQAAAVALTEASLKTPDPAAFTAALVRQAAAWDVLRTFYGGKAFAPKKAPLPAGAAEAGVRRAGDQRVDCQE